MIEKPLPDVLTHFTTFYDLLVLCYVYLKAEMRQFAAAGTEELNWHLIKQLVEDGPKIATFNEAIEKLEKIYVEHSEIDAKIEENMSELCKWSELSKKNRLEIQNEVENALDLLKTEKVKNTTATIFPALQKLQEDSNI